MESGPYITKAVDTQMKEFDKKILFVGYGSVAQCALPVLLKLIKVPAKNITVMDFEDKRGVLKPWLAKGVKFVREQVTKKNMGPLLGKYLSAGDMMIDLAWNIDACEILQWCHDKGVASYQLVRQVAAFAPKGSLVGSVEHASSCLLYTELVPFLSNHPQSPELIAWALAHGRRVYLIPEPWSSTEPVTMEIKRRFLVREVARCRSPWNLLPVYELSAR